MKRVEKDGANLRAQMHNPQNVKILHVRGSENEPLSRVAETFFRQVRQTDTVIRQLNLRSTNTHTHTVSHI